MKEITLPAMADKVFKIVRKNDDDKQKQRSIILQEDGEGDELTLERPTDDLWQYKEGDYITAVLRPETDPEDDRNYDIQQML